MKFEKFLSVSEKHPELIMEVEFERNVHYYVITMFLPCIMMVLISWVSFWIKGSEVTCRMIIGMYFTTLLKKKLSLFIQFNFFKYSK